MSSRLTGRERTRQMVIAALIASLTAASAWLNVQLGTVPVTLQVFFVVLAALLLAPQWAAASMSLYLALGALGLPVFSGGKAGVSVLLGPTGGYLFGFVIGAFLGALLRRWLEARLPQLAADAVAATAVIATVYLVGTVQLALVTGMGATAAVAAGLVPFIVPDVLKAVAAIAVASAIRRATGGLAA